MSPQSTTGRTRTRKAALGSRLTTACILTALALTGCTTTSSPKPETTLVPTFKVPSERLEARDACEASDFYERLALGWCSRHLVDEYGIGDGTPAVIARPDAIWHTKKSFTLRGTVNHGGDPHKITCTLTDVGPIKANIALRVVREG